MLYEVPTETHSDTGNAKAGFYEVRDLAILFRCPPSVVCADTRVLVNTIRGRRHMVQARLSGTQLYGRCREKVGGVAFGMTDMLDMMD